MLALLRHALRDELRLPALGEGWVLLHHEWRFRAEGRRGLKCDLLAVHLPSGRLGIVELKDADSKLLGAEEQVRGYAALWSRDARELAPVFTQQLQAMGRLYGNTAASLCTLRPWDARLFVGVVGPDVAPRIEELAP